MNDEQKPISERLREWASEPCPLNSAMDSYGISLYSFDDEVEKLFCNFADEIDASETVKQISLVGDGRMAMNAGKQGDFVFVYFYDTGSPHDLNETLPQPFKSMKELLDSSEVILNFTNAKSIDNLIDTLESAKAMLVNIEEFKRENQYDISDGD